MPTPVRSGRVQEAAVIFRRSGVLPKLEGEERRIFDAVVKPERRDRATGTRPPRSSAAERDRPREGMLANERFVKNAPADVVEAEREKLARYRRELDAVSD